MEEEKNKKINRKKIFVMLGPALIKRWRYWPFFVLTSLLMSFLNIAEPFIYGSIVDILIAAVQHGSGFGEISQALFLRLIFWALFVLCGTIFSSLYAYFRWQHNNVIYADFATTFLAKLLKLDYRRFQEERAGEILRRFTNTDEGLWQLNDLALRWYLPAVSSFCFSLIAGLWLNPRLLAVAFIPIPIILGSGLYNYFRTSPYHEKVQDIWEKTTGLVGDAFTNIVPVKSFIGESSFVKRFLRLSLQAVTSQGYVSRKWAFSEALYGGAYVFGRLLIFGFGALFVLRGQTTIGTLIMFLGFINYLYSAIQQLVESLPELAKAFAKLSRAADLWSDVPLIRDPEKPVKIGRLKGDVKFEELSYTYQNEKKVLHQVSFSIPAGQMVALIGESGAGKSTIAKLLLRFQDPTHGRITVDGIDLRSLRLEDARRQIGYVMQESTLFNDTIENNIRFAKPTATKQEVIKAAKRAQAHTFIVRLKQGYGSKVGERGVKLSGGEKQRIALARVFLADPPILVLDEATSALDSKTEHAVQQALHEAMKGRTSLVIAHRLSTVMQADNILVLDRGRIVDQGTHAELINRPGPYAHYWKLQAGGYV